MAAPSEKLAQSLEALHQLQNSSGAAAIRARDLSRTHRERLLANGFLQEVIKGWYIPARPDEVRGDSTPWYASFWRFCSAYLQARFKNNWCLSPEQSLSLHGGNWTVPRQLVVRSPKARNKVTRLPHGTSLLDLRSALPALADREEKERMRVFSLESALIGSSANYFSTNSTDARAVLSMVRDPSALLARLLEGGHSKIAGRLAGAFRNARRDRVADEIMKTMSAAGYDVRETDPFTDRPSLILPVRETSPYVNRIRLLWQKMRGPIINRFPPAPGLPRNISAYMKRVDGVYPTDAYHSLSIEGYRVTPELIERVRRGGWNPEKHLEDREQRNAMAARGYWQAFQAVRNSVGRVLHGENSGFVADEDHRTWYREIFAPSVTAGLLRPADLAGYRNTQVYIRRSKHVPLNREAVRDAMPVLFELLQEETVPAARVVLAHFIFVYIHPYMDGNGRMGRFLMNLMLASGGYPWTVIPVSDRKNYMEALEQASVGENIIPFADFLAGLVTKSLTGKPLPPIPKPSSQI
ncbi:MAG TPA: Fic family protein [Candidatus Angelobacter sp.]|jgi:fido (protein-threonine AMPylation protein)|nr:Fic family protein [Candidatus Angelobacter sp.]